MPVRLLQGEGLEAVLPAAPLPSVLCASGWGERDRLLRICGRKLRQPLAAPAPAIFWAAGFSFSRSKLIEEVSHPKVKRVHASLHPAHLGCKMQWQVLAP